MIEKKTATEIEEILLEAMDNQDPGHSYDYEIIAEGFYNGLSHNGVWVRVIKFDNNHYAYAEQSDAYDQDPAIGSLTAVAEWIEECIDMALDREEGEVSLIEASY